MRAFDICACPAIFVPVRASLTHTARTPRGTGGLLLKTATALAAAGADARAE